MTFRDLQDAYKPLGLETWNDKEEDRLEAIAKYVHTSTYRVRIPENMANGFELQCQNARKGRAYEEANQRYAFQFSFL